MNIHFLHVTIGDKKTLKIYVIYFINLNFLFFGWFPANDYFINI